MVSAKAPSLRTRPARCGLAAAALGMAAAVGSAEELSVARRTPLRLRRLPPLRTRQGSLEARWSAVDGGTGCLAHTACTGASFRVGRGTRRALGVAGGSSWDGQPNGQGYGAGQEYGAYGGDGEADDRDLYQGGRGGAGSGFDPNQSPVAGMSPPGYGSEGMGQVPQQPGNPQSEEVPSQIIAMLVGQTYTSVAVLFFILIFRALHNYELADQMENPAKAAFVKLGLSALMFGNTVGFLGALTRRRGLKSVMKMTLSANAFYEGLAFCASFSAILLHKTMYVRLVKLDLVRNTTGARQKEGCS
mmetsp:Transcript_61666/g.169592  ORF Transcript_61666/g.169592 Transcript_61666/m.169592 type:complete len:303 (-) Transcript_61666:236-1144(-)